MLQQYVQPRRAARPPPDLNVNNPPFDDIGVGKAMQMAINLEGSSDV